LPDREANSAADHGDPSQDVAVASVLFLVDGKLVLLQPTTSDHGELKYEMRIIAQDVEYYALMRDQLTFTLDDHPDVALNGDSGPDLKDSLWLFDGRDMCIWSDVQDVLMSAPSDLGRDLPDTVRASVDFYPMSALLSKGILFGIESELVQRRDVPFAYLRFSTRVRCCGGVFIAHRPPILRHCA
jgi:RAB6A-GEF complex partner protein 1